MWKLISVIAFLLAGWFVFANVDSKDAARTRTINSDVEILIKAVNAYHTRTGTYPDALSDLQDNYMLNVPVNPDGKPYKYVVSKDGLSFSIQNPD